VTYSGSALTAIELRFEQRFEAAIVAVNAAPLLADQPEVRAWAEESRPLLVDLGARPWLEMLDAALAAVANPASLPTASSAEVPAGPAERSP